MNVTVWNENFDETNGVEAVLKVHPNGIHNTVKEIIEELGEDVHVRTATLQEENIGLPDEVLDNTDVLVWWGHKAHAKVPDEIVAKIHHRVLAGMGLILLHSAHYSKLLKTILGTSGDLKWRHNSYERLFCVNPSHPIAEGIPETIELGMEECYTEYFDIPKPDDVVFLGWFEIGNVLRSGCTWTRGYGKIFYFQPGHETNTSYFNKDCRKIIQNAVKWACPHTYKTSFGAPKIELPLEEQRTGKKFPED